jgi:PiT family inorganic phosphate transporter
MELTALVFLSSGLFLGWSLGANDAANVFGTAVGSRMIRFGTAAGVCSAFVLLGAVLSGAGAAHGLGELGSVNALPGAFTAAFSAALTVYGMTRAGLPVSTTQAIVGAIVGWNGFSGSITDTSALVRILLTWVACPLLGAAFAAALYLAAGFAIRRSRVHLLCLDGWTRFGLIVAGALGAYSLGANNIGNVMGVFVESSPFTVFAVGPWLRVTSVQQLFFVGAAAIGVGVFTYSRRVMLTVGGGIVPLNPVGAWVVVVAHSVVLLLFSSVTLEHALASRGLPTIPLIPVSSSQAVVGSVLGIGLVKGAAGIRWRALGSIASGWVTTPVASAVTCFVLLFVLQNVFNQTVYVEERYVLDAPALGHLRAHGVPVETLTPVAGEEEAGGVAFRKMLRRRTSLPREHERRVVAAARLQRTRVTPEALSRVEAAGFGESQRIALRSLLGRSFDHAWQLHEALAAREPAWRARPEGKLHRKDNARLAEQRARIERLLGATEAGEGGR